MTLKQAYLREFTPKVIIRSEIHWFTEFCNSQCLTHFAAPFISFWTETSVAESCKIHRFRFRTNQGYRPSRLIQQWQGAGKHVAANRKNRSKLYYIVASSPPASILNNTSLLASKTKSACRYNARACVSTMILPVMLHSPLCGLQACIVFSCTLLFSHTSLLVCNINSALHCTLPLLSHSITHLHHISKS